MLALFFIFPCLCVVIDPKAYIFKNDRSIDSDLGCYVHVKVMFHACCPLPVLTGRNELWFTKERTIFTAIPSYQAPTLAGGSFICVFLMCFQLPII